MTEYKYFVKKDSLDLYKNLLSFFNSKLIFCWAIVFAIIPVVKMKVKHKKK